jgi:3'-phosphoadenosine 5'-phosphosulfate sulfotransferase (PAPS reductase)/FAD synthetase
VGKEGGNGKDNGLNNGLNQNEVKHIVSFSGGKDSTAMLLMMLEKKMQVDEIIFCDTGKEFPQMYEHIRQVEKYIGQEVTVLRAEKSFDWYLAECKRKTGDYTDVIGYGWPDIRCRWCTGFLKEKVFKKYLSGQDYICYQGIAYDEPKRIKNAKSTKYPLYDWKITEKQALAYCYSHVFSWGGLYEIFNRVSCWCCPLQPLRELENLYNYFPELWAELIEMDKKSWRRFKDDYTVAQLTEKFELRKRQMKLFED